MEDEEVFLCVISGLSSQGWQRSFRGGQPMLRGPHGRKCPFGWLISDKDYSPGMDELEEPWPTIPGTRALRDRLGKAHDHSFSPRDMYKRFESMAAELGFEWPDFISASKPSASTYFDD